MRERIREAFANSQGILGVSCLSIGVGLRVGVWAALVVVGVVFVTAEAWRSR